MESVTDYYPGKPYQTRVWITNQARKEISMVSADLGAIFESRAEKGFNGYQAEALRKEGTDVWAFGTAGDTTRICGFFADERTRRNFVVCGVWKGKAGKGGKRPHQAEAIVERTQRIKEEGVRYVVQGQ